MKPGTLFFISVLTFVLAFAIGLLLGIAACKYPTYMVPLGWGCGIWLLITVTAGSAFMTETYSVWNAVRCQSYRDILKKK